MALAPALEAAPDIEYLGGIGRETDLFAALRNRRPQALVDFTHPSVALEHAILAAQNGVAPIIGTSGITAEGVDQLEQTCTEHTVGGIVAPNFAIGGVLMMWLAEMASPHFEAAEVIEAHAATKADAPSGTALATARRLAAARTERPFSYARTERLMLDGARGAVSENVAIHSIRMPGLVADQQVVFGLPGQTLTIEHRTTSREAYAPGVLLAIRRVIGDKRFYRGLDELLGLS
jgi:4-hydroxy-tetrahydrodipicolinate reductase